MDTIKQEALTMCQKINEQLKYTDGSSPERADLRRKWNKWAAIAGIGDSNSQSQDPCEVAYYPLHL